MVLLKLIQCLEPFMLKNKNVRQYTDDAVLYTRTQSLVW